MTHSVFNRLVTTCAIAMASGLVLFAAPSAEAAEFRKPMVEGYRLDWCREWASDCGKPAADMFCKARGFSQATAFTPAQNIGAKTPTRVIGTGQICDKPFCDGFRSITCR